MKLRKGMVLHFISRNEEETILKASNNHITGDIITDKQTYSTDFIQRWLHFGFVTIKPKTK